MKSYCSKVICLGLLCLLVSTGISVAQAWQKTSTRFGWDTNGWWWLFHALYPGRSGRCYF
jgi:hypothetical protein